MKRKLAYLTGVFFLFFIGLLAVDIQSNDSGNLISQSISTSAHATACGVGYLNHQAPDPNYIPCWYGPGATQFTIEEQHDCKDSDDSCCRYPDLDSPCPSIGG